jgi:hypothetical protein
MNYILSSRDRTVGPISEAVYSLSIPSALLTSDIYTVRLSEFSTINSIYKLNEGDFLKINYGETEKVLTVSSDTEGVYSNLSAYIELITTAIPELSISVSTHQQKCTFSVSGSPVFSMTMSGSFARLLGMSDAGVSGSTSYRSSSICDLTPPDYLKIETSFTNLNHTINQNTISLVHSQVPSFYKFTTSENLFSMLVPSSDLKGSLLTIRILHPTTDQVIKLNADYTLVLSLQ